MNPSDSHNSQEHYSNHSKSVHSTEGWHRFVTGLCLLVCVGLIMTGIEHVFDLGEGRVVAARPMDYIQGISFILLGVQGCRFLVRQFRAPAFTSARKQPNPK